MGKYLGDTFKILCRTKGINNDLNINAIEPDELIWPSKNIDLSKGGWGRRGGTAKINGTVISGAPRIMGLFDFHKVAGSRHIVFATNDGKIYKTSTSTIKTGLGANKYTHFTTFNDVLVSCNGYDVPQYWNGTDAATTSFVSGTKAQGLITISGVETAYATCSGFIIGTETFAYKQKRLGAFDITLGATAAILCSNIIAALNADSTLVTATAGTGDTVLVTAKAVGVAANALWFYPGVCASYTTMNGSGYLGGTTAGVDGELPSDWSGTNNPAVMIRHGRGNSERLWAFGCSSNPYMIYVTPSSTKVNFSDGNLITFSVDTGDDTGIVGGVEYRDQLILFGKKNTFIIDDTDTDTDNWGYKAFTGEGGVAHQRLVIPTPNDVICMMEDGTIYSLAVTEQYGDYRAASITQSKFMDRWVQDNVELSLIEHFHGIYDPVKRVVKIFVIRTGQTTVDTAMIYYIETGEWMIEDNISYNSGYSASASVLVKVSSGVYEIYTGDYSGFIWHLEQTAKNDDSNGYESRALTPYLYFENPRTSKLYQRCWMDLEPDNAYSLTIRYLIDAIYSTTESMSGEAGALGSFVLGHSILGPERMARISFPIGRIGQKIQLEFMNSTADEDFFISQIMIDFLSLGVGLAR